MGASHIQTNSIGLGLRPVHYDAILASRPNIDFFEIISENYMLQGGKPLQMLDQIRQAYPIVMHGVSLAIGNTAPFNPDYLSELKILIQRVAPAWVSDHLCWTTAHGVNSHDLLPLPYTQASLTHLTARIHYVQEYLQRSLVIENPSTYLQFHGDTYDEVDFLTALTRATGCELLLDVNNVYVNSVNHGFDAADYLRRLHAGGATVRQIHLAGHTTHDDYLIDTHDHPVCDAVWHLYELVHRLYGAIPTLIERDDDIPPLDDLLSELATVRRLQQDSTAITQTTQTFIANQVQ